MTEPLDAVLAWAATRSLVPMAVIGTAPTAGLAGWLDPRRAAGLGRAALAPGPGHADLLVEWVSAPPLGLTRGFAHRPDTLLGMVLLANDGTGYFYNAGLVLPLGETLSLGNLDNSAALVADIEACQIAGTSKRQQVVQLGERVTGSAHVFQRRLPKRLPLQFRALRCGQGEAPEQGRRVRQRVFAVLSRR